MSDLSEHWLWPPPSKAKPMPTVHAERQHVLHVWMANRHCGRDFDAAALATLLDAAYNDGWIDGQRCAAAKPEDRVARGEGCA